MNNASFSTVFTYLPFTSFSVTSASPHLTATFIVFVPSANSMQCSVGLKVPSTLLKMLVVTMWDVAPVSTSNPVGLL